MIYVCGYSRHGYWAYCTRRGLNPTRDAVWVNDTSALQGRTIGPRDEVVAGPLCGFDMWKEIQARRAR